MHAVLGNMEMRSHAYEESTGYIHVIAAHLPPPLAVSKALPDKSFCSKAFARKIH